MDVPLANQPCFFLHQGYVTSNKHLLQTDGSVGWENLVLQLSLQ